MNTSVIIEAYHRILAKTVTSAPLDLKSWDRRDIAKYVHAWFRLLSMSEDAAENIPDAYMSSYFAVCDACRLLTPNEFESIFPIHKDYSGKKYGFKDYFSTKEAIAKFGADKPIGSNVSEFLWEYDNWIVKIAVVNSMTAMSRIRRQQGKKELLEFFFELARFKVDVSVEMAKDKLAAGINGMEWLVLNTDPDDERKRQLEESIREYDGLQGFLEAAKKSIHTEGKDIHDMIKIRDLITQLALLRERKYDEYLQVLDWLYEEGAR